MPRLRRAGASLQAGHPQLGVLRGLPDLPGDLPERRKRRPGFDLQRGDHGIAVPEGPQAGQHVSAEDAAAADGPGGAGRLVQRQPPTQGRRGEQPLVVRRGQRDVREAARFEASFQALARLESGQAAEGHAHDVNPGEDAIAVVCLKGPREAPNQQDHARHAAQHGQNGAAQAGRVWV